jgi:riboflavin kinase
MRFYPGTLNVELSSSYSVPADAIRLEASEYGGSVSISIVPCRIFGRPAFLLRTDQNQHGTGHHPRNIIEIATDIRLRDAYELKDGDLVDIQFP